MHLSSQRDNLFIAYSQALWKHRACFFALLALVVALTAPVPSVAYATSPHLMGSNLSSQRDNYYYLLTSLVETQGLFFVVLFYILDIYVVLC